MTTDPRTPACGHVWLVLRFAPHLGGWQADSVWPDDKQARERTEAIRQAGEDPCPYMEWVNLEALSARIFECEGQRLARTAPVLEARRREGEALSRRQEGGA